MGDKRPDKQMPPEIKMQIGPSTTESWTSASIRIYKEEPVQGRAKILLVFGESEEKIAALLEIIYEFTVTSFPDKYGIEASLKREMLIDPQFIYQTRAPKD